MRGLYISNLDPLTARSYQKKIIGQIKGMQRWGAILDLICTASPNRIILKKIAQSNDINNEEKTLTYFSNNLLSRRLSLLRTSLDFITKTAPDFLYLRYPRSDPFYIFFLNKIKSQCPTITILSEIPTYPYETEYKKTNLKGQFILSLDRLTRPLLKRYIDRMVVVAWNQPLFGIPSINLLNGIDVASIKPLQTPRSFNEEIHLIGVGNLQFWHGYDRLIQGFKNYYQQQAQEVKVFFHIISPDTPTLHTLQETVKSQNLSEYIIFHGAKYDQELDQLFEKCHIAVADLGGHRKGIQQTSFLKTREFAARGIPFITSADDPDFPNTFPYQLKVTSNEQPLDVTEVIKFTQSIYRDAEHPIKIRQYAQSSLDWSVKMKEVYEVTQHLVHEKIKMTS
ncbi:hypothetical protein PCC7418_2993 [Halothece sp. PCC 7418]|uniref:glycosyltransferase n=1 Tax=Halothece sp. (strain PCC 7418) TaxID=65093 RepID=UPI0002A06955|nr:glycosyltransferase [Halothece sp. PCC 7418]AFZ45120.1 hypothetical protein PCC7418_2993 [Halothece sp. PCC 7418]